MILLTLALAVVLGRGCQGSQATLSPLSPWVQEHVRRIGAGLPLDSAMRRLLGGGDRGDGVHCPWMDAMRQEGVRRAVVRTEFLWRGKPTKIWVSEVVYFSEYHGDCAQITDPDRLRQIRSSGLEDELGKVAVHLTPEAHLFFMDKRPRFRRGLCDIELFDDCRLPSAPAALGPAPKKPQSLRDAAANRCRAEGTGPPTLRHP